MADDGIFDRFTTAHCNLLKVNGRVNEGGRKLPFFLTIEDDFLLKVTNSDGFLFSCSVNKDRRRGCRTTCVLANGTEIGVVLTFNRTCGYLEVRPTNSDFGWFWIDIMRRF
jgi:hypothetical protein